MTSADKVRTALRWTAAGTAGSELLGLVFLVILARLLTPEDYGLVSLLGAIIALSLTVVDSGLAKTLVQKQDLQPDDEVTAFMLQIGLGLAMSVAIFLSAPWVARFFADPRLEALTYAASLRPLLTSFAPIQQARLERRMDFKSQAIVDLLANLLAGIAATAIACMGYGPWALIAQMLLWAGCRSGLLWLRHPWRPAGRFTRASVCALLPFSWRLLVSGFINSAFSQLHTLAIGRLLAISDVGLYNRARSLQEPVTAAMGTIVHKVSFSAYARLQDDRIALLAAYRKTMRLMSAINAPAMLGLAAVAPTLVPAVLGSQWSDATSLVQGFALCGLFIPLTAQSQHVLLALGRADLVLRLTILKHVLTVLLLAATWQYGLIAIIIGIGIRCMIVHAIASLVLLRYLGYALVAQFRDVLPAHLAGCLAAVTAMATHIPGSGYDLAQLAIQVATGAGAWLALVFLLRHGMHAEIWSEMRRFIRH
ncbi:MAG: lipopolysaccharide biosynthesis protein [Planctomycetes bacterium]|nr:lipopolysaccharide biosynthesis protein [Planctomycetota bacterium]